MAIINLIKVEKIQSTQINDLLPKLLTNTTDDFEMRIRVYNIIRIYYENNWIKYFKFMILFTFMLLNYYLNLFQS